MARIRVVGDGKNGSKRMHVDGVESTVERMETFIIESDSRRRGRVMKVASDDKSAGKDATSSVASREKE